MTVKDRSYLQVVKGIGDPDKAAPTPPKGAPVVEDPWAVPAEFNEAEGEVWSELRAEYAAALSDADYTLFAKLVAREVQYREAQKEVRRLGMLIKSPSGYPIQNPYLAIANKASAEMLRISVQLGLTPLSRGRVKGTGKGRKRASSPFAHLKSLDD